MAAGKYLRSAKVVRRQLEGADFSCDRGGGSKNV